MYDIKDKVVLVTGGAAGIGAGIVQAFLEEGAKHVAALDLNVENGEALQDKFRKKYGSERVKFHVCDVTTNDLETVYSSVVADYEYIDVIVNCAGLMNDRPNVYLKEIAVNVSALITSSFKAYDLMRKDHGGRGGTIINISSIVALTQPSILPVYAATKSAVMQFSNCLGMETNYSRTEVRVIVLCFGCTDTTLFDTTKIGAFDKETDIILEKVIKDLPMQKQVVLITINEPVISNLNHIMKKGIMLIKECAYIMVPESAVKGLISAYKHGASGSTWLITSDKPAEDITAKVTKAYEIMGQGVYS